MIQNDISLRSMNATASINFCKLFQREKRAQKKPGRQPGLEINYKNQITRTKLQEPNHRRQIAKSNSKGTNCKSRDHTSEIGHLLEAHHLLELHRLTPAYFNLVTTF
jgi:hypothetical protein